MRKKEKSQRNRPLVSGHLENVASSLFDDYLPIIKSYVQGEHGIYALYKQDRLYYVGLAKDLSKRLKQHQRDQHKGKWDLFSVFLVRKVDHIKELETLILKIAYPKGNRVKGKFAGSENLKPRLTQDIKSYLNKELDNVINPNKRQKSNSAKKIRRLKESGVNASLIILAPYVIRRFRIKGMRNGVTFKAIVLSNGKIRYNGRLFNSPSGAGKAATNRSTNGWTFWKFKNPKGEWVRLNKLKRK